MRSAAVEIAAEIAELADEDVAAIIDGLTSFELALLWRSWLFWARPDQIFPDGSWRSHGFLTARRFGKTRSCAEFVVGEAMAGRAMRIGMMAQNETRTFEVMVDGETGLLACSPPWFPASWERGRVVWPNGAQAFPFTPEVPGAIRGPGVSLFWASEIQSWPTVTRDEAWYNASLMCSLGYARTIWDATPKRRHPILRMLIARAQSEPDRHHIVRGSIEENALNLGHGVIEDLRKDMDGTQRGREELFGEFLDEADGALWKQAWIDDARPGEKAGPPTEPKTFARRILSVDPAISTREGTDPTGIIELGLGLDGQVYVLDDLSGKLEPETWADIVVNRYFDAQCDCVVVERNRGANLLPALLRARAQQLGVRVAIVEKGQPTRHAKGVMYVREVIAYATDGKAERAVPVAAMYEAHRVSHVRSADLAALEDELTTWEPPETSGKRVRSPNRLDALVWGVRVLANLDDEKADPMVGFAGIEQLGAALRKPVSPTLAELLVRGGRSGRL